MANARTCRYHLVVEPLEERMTLNGSSAANVIGTSTGAVVRPHQVSRTTVTVSPANITPAKHATIFGLFVQPTTGSSLEPRILAARGSAGQTLPIKHGRSYRPGRSDQTVAFTKDHSPGPLATDLTGAHQTIGSYVAQTTLVGDINGDGKVNFADSAGLCPLVHGPQGRS